MTLDSLLNCGADPETFSLNPAAFDRLHETHDADQIRWLNDWIEPQHVCDLVMRDHGRTGLERVLKGIALASATKQIHMSERVAAVAGFYEYEIY